MSDYLSACIQAGRDWDFERERSQQQQPGWSEMSSCRAYLGHKVRGAWPTDDVDNWRATAGTVLHAWWTGVRAQWALSSGQRLAHDLEVSYRGIPGHVDEADYTCGEITDFKFPAMRSVRVWDDPEVQAEKFVQLQGYGAAVVGTQEWRQAAESAGRDPRQATLRLLVAPVDGTYDDWRVYEQPFDQAVADAAVDRYEAVASAAAAGSPLQRDKPLAWCERFCEFFTSCRGPRAEAEAADGDWPQILDPETAAALERYGESRDLESAGRKDKELAALLIRGVRGEARGWRVSMTNRGQGKLVPDVEQIMADYANSNVPMPMTWQPGSAPALQVTRVPAPKARGRDKKAAS